MVKILPRYTNKIQVVFRSCLLKALDDWFSVSEEDCPVLFAGQPPIQTAKRYITFYKISSTQIGQGHHVIQDAESPTGLTEIESWIDELTFQINVRTKETKDDDENTVMAHDIADGLRAWFNSWQGIEYLQANHIAALKTTQLRDLVGADESDLFQNTTSFDVTLHVGQGHSRVSGELIPRLKGLVGV